MKGISTRIRSLTKTDITTIILMTAVSIFLFFMAFFDGTVSDEAFYITIPYRLMYGDGLFTDEWHLSQLSGVLLYLPVKFFTGITGTTQGIILFMRILFCIMQLSVSTYIYITFRKEGIAAALISLSFMLFSVIGINTLSYNTMGVALLFVIICIAYNLPRESSRTKMFALGALLAMFILCQPIGVFFYFIYFIVTVIINISFRKKEKAILFPFTVKSFSLTVAGILPVFVFFLYLLFRNSDIKTIIECIPGILSDVEHMEISEALGIETFSALQFFVDMTMAAGTVPLIVTAIVIVSAVIIKKRSKNIAVIITSLALAAFTLVFYYRMLFKGQNTETDDINFFFFPLAISGIAFYLLADKKNHKVFILLWCTGVMYALFMTISSNLRLHASVNGYIISAAGSVILAKDLLREIKFDNTTNKTKNAAPILLTVTVFAFTMFNIVATTCNYTFTRANYHSYKMTNGVYAGINLPSDQALAYHNLHTDIDKIKEIIAPEDRVFVLENMPAAYLEGNFKVGAFSGWFLVDQLSYPEIRDRFRNYYEINPDNIPDYIYVPAYVYTEFGLEPAVPKMLAEFAYALFEGKTEDIGSGLLITVTGIKDE